MIEFNDRMAVQRKIVQTVNEKFDRGEELFSLSNDAIERWLSANSMDKNSEVAKLLYEMSSKLFFLAAKSQEQVSAEYVLLSSEIKSLLQGIQNHCTP